MIQPSSSSQAAGVHYFQAAQRLGISVQHLMHLERTGAIDPPRSLERGQGRFYTQAELDAIVERLSLESSPSEGIRARGWWFAAAGALIVVAFLVLTRAPAPPPKTAETARTAEPRSRPSKPKADRIDLEREEPDAPPGVDQAGPRFRAGTADSPPHDVSPEQRADMEESEARVQELHKKGIYY
jgi:MerR HTH family regulatory protein